MKVKPKPRRCGCCVWNQVRECGVHFCAVPRCMMERGAGAPREARRPWPSPKGGPATACPAKAGQGPRPASLVQPKADLKGGAL